MPAQREMVMSSEAELCNGKVGDKIDRYTLVEVLGEGGFGVVWLAEQLEPVRREVALKILKAGMDSRPIIARFGQERQALAHMNHPNIARVFDAGTASNGRPYFVMELVRGPTLTDFARTHRLDMEARLRLFIQVCAGIQHAHQKGLIHRDIKPSNILVVVEEGGRPVPKIIDFGIAKAMEGRVWDRALVTSMDQVLGTPAYMSPEQLDASDGGVDTRGDIYSLGVLLYELITGKPPFDPAKLAKEGRDEMRRVICFEEPVRPSTHSHRKDATTGLQADAPGCEAGDLDWITLKCLEKDRSQRYATVNELADDIQRHLGQLPVIARSPSRTYRLRKMMRRNKAGFTAALLVAVTLVLGTILSTTQMLRAQRAERLKDAEADRAYAAEQTALRLLAESAAAHERLRRENYRAQIQLAQGRLEGPMAHTVPELLRTTEADLRGWEWGWLTAQCAPPTWHIQTEGGPVRHMVINGAGTRLFTASEDGGLSAWSVPDRKLLWQHKGRRVNDIACQKNGDYLAVIRRTDDGSRLDILDATTGRQLHERVGANALSCVWAPHGTCLYVASSQEIFKLLAGSWEKKERWTVETTAAKQELVMDAAGQHLAVMESWDGPWVWLDADSLQPVKRVPGPRPSRAFGAACLDAQHGWQMCSFGRTLYSATLSGPVSFTSVYVHPVNISHILVRGQDRLLVAGDDHLVEIRQDGTLLRSQRLPQRITAMCSDDAGTVYLTGASGMLWCHDSPDSTLSASFLVEDPVGGRFLSFMGEGNHLLSFRHILAQPFLITLDDGRGQKSDQPVPATHAYEDKASYRHTQGLPRLHPGTGEVVTAGGNELHLHSFDGQSRWNKRALPVDGRPYSAAFDKAEKFMLVATEKGVSLHDLQKKRTTAAPIPSPGGSLVDLTLDGRLALVINGKRACVWETATGTVLLDRTFSAALTGALHPGGEVVALNARSKDIHLLPLQPGRVETTLRSAGRWPHVLRFTSDGNRLYTAGPENKLWWFDWRLGKELLVLNERGNITDAILSPDGRTLATCGPGISAHLRTAVAR
jgi:hypothetical protein